MQLLKLKINSNDEVGYLYMLVYHYNILKSKTHITEYKIHLEIYFMYIL